MTTMADNKDKKVLNVPHLRFPEFSGEWDYSTIGSEFDLYSGNTPSRLDKEQFNGDVNWISSGELKEHYIYDTKEKITEEAASYNNLRLLPIGTFVIAIYGLEAEGVRGTGSIIKKKSTISQACMAFSSKGAIINEFLYSWYKKHGNLIGLKYAQGTKQQNLSYDIISQFRISYPSIKEQKKLEEFISLLDERIATQNKIIEDLKLLKSAIAETVFNNMKGHLTNLSAICNIVKGKQVNGEELSEKGKYYVMNGGITPSGYYDQCNTPPNTISISEGGNSCGYVQYNKSSFWSGGHCYTLQDITSGVDTQYLFHYLKRYESHIMNLRIGTGLPNIQKKDLENFRIALPPSNNQKEISTCLTAIEDKIMVEVKWLDSAQREKQHLLRQMFI